MTEELARRAIACKGWRWMPGMLGLSAKAGSWRVEQTDLTTLFGAGAGPASIHEVGVWLPDLTDPATVGCLLALVREAWGFQAFVTLTSGGWHVLGFPWEPDLTSSSRLASGPTEAAALVAALEAAP